MRLLIYICLFGFLAVSCKSKKKLAANKPLNVDSMLFVNNANGKDSLWRQPWEYFSGRLDVDYYSADDEQSGKISLRMRRDSIIWFSASASIGLQVLKGIITNDSIVLLNLIDRKYYLYGIKELSNRFGVAIGLHELQNIFIGNPVYDTMVYAKDSNAGAWIAVNPPLSSVIFGKDHQLPDSSFLTQKGSMRQLKTTYLGRLEAGKLTIANVLDLFAFSASNTVRIRFEFKSATDDVIPSYPFAIPAGYERAGE